MLNNEAEWAIQLKPPGQAEIEESISQLEADPSRSEEMLARKKQDLAMCRSRVEVLYQVGPPLEIAVKAMLAEMGASIREAPDSGGNYPFSVDVRGVAREAVLKIKVTDDERFDLEELKQIAGWRLYDGFTQNKFLHCVFVGNSNINTPPDDRVYPFDFEWQKQSRSMDVTAIATSTLYAVYCDTRNDEQLLDYFWWALFDSGGVLSPSSFIRVGG